MYWPAVQIPLGLLNIIRFLSKHDVNVKCYWDNIIPCNNGVFAGLSKILCPPPPHLNTILQNTLPTSSSPQHHPTIFDPSHRSPSRPCLLTLPHPNSNTNEKNLFRKIIYSKHQNILTAIHDQNGSVNLTSCTRFISPKHLFVSIDFIPKSLFPSPGRHSFRYFNFLFPNSSLLI